MRLKATVRYIIPILLMVVAVFQLYHSKNGLLSPWKGAGFGMYSNLHWNNNQVWVISKDSAYSVISTIGDWQPHEVKTYQKVQRNPTTANLEQLSKIIFQQQEHSNFQLQVWEGTLKEHSKPLEFTRTKINEYVFEGP